MKRYKSWSGLKKILEGLLCPSLKGKVNYFLTRYHSVHNAYGRAAILFDRKELVCFSWIEMYRQDAALNALYRDTGIWDTAASSLKERWDASGTYCEADFLRSALAFLDMPIQAALRSDDYIIKILAILDRRTGVRTLQKIADSGEYLQYPQWAKQFYTLRLTDGVDIPSLFP